MYFALAIGRGGGRGRSNPGIHLSFQNHNVNLVLSPLLFLEFEFISVCAKKKSAFSTGKKVSYRPSAIKKV